nr:ABC transporter ATP-binding protein [Naasia sp. SYSU D00057]
MLTSDHPIVVRALHKHYGATPALDDLDLTVGAGEVHGFLGPNGAGKSTTIRILLGLIRATSGSVQVLGRDPWPDPVVTNRDIAYVPGDVSLWPNLTGGEIIDLLLSLRGGGGPGERARLIDAFELDPRRKARTYSKGNRQKVALVAALARPAPLYILDEPTSGLDPVMESVFRAEVRRIRNTGATVLLSSHMLSEVEQLCDRVTVIRAGRVVETGRLDDLLRNAPTVFRVIGVPAEAVIRVPGVTGVHSSGDGIEFAADSSAIPAVLHALHSFNPSSLTATPPALETLFLRHYETARS